jgi:pilus assembly protein FimV
MQAASLGLTLDPSNPLYAAGKAVPESGVGLTAPTRPLDEPDLDALLANTTSDTSLETLNTIENSSYFSNSGVPNQAHGTPTAAASAAAASAAATPSDLDFDLEGLSAENLDMPTTIARPPVDAPKLDFENIDFDFLKEKDLPKPPDTIAATAFQHQPAAEPMAAPMEFTAEDFATPLPEIPGIVEPFPAASETPEIIAESPPPMDFDLSGITLELDPSETKPVPAPEIHLDNIHDIHNIPVDQDDNATDYSNVAEMSTKLDLAVAYQEIGDKEGARELLDEVVKGGTPEQTDKAKTLLSKLA